MRTLFVRLELNPRPIDSSLDDVMEGVAKLCWSWVRDSSWVDSSSLPTDWAEGTFETNHGDYLSVTDTRTNIGRFWRMIREETGREDENLRYINHIFLVRDNNIVEFSILQDIISISPKVSESSIPIYPPYLIRSILKEFDCKFEEQEIRKIWTPLPPKSVPNFIDEIFHPERKLPIVLLSKRWKSRESLVRKPGSLSGRLAGMASVYRLGDTNTSQFRDLFGKQWVSNGSIRIYWPDLDEDTVFDESDFFNLYTPHRFEKEFEEDEGALCQHIINRICSATASIPASSELVQRIRLSIEQKERDEISADFEEKITNSLREIEGHEEQIDYLSSELRDRANDIVQSDILLSSSRESLRVEKEKNVSLINRLIAREGELNQLKPIVFAVKEAKRRNPESVSEDFLSHINKFGDENDFSDEPAPEPEFESLAHAVKMAQQNFSARIFFSEDCSKSAADYKGDVDPSDVYEVFRILHDDVWLDMKKTNDKKLNFIIKDVMREYFQTKYAASESRETMEKYGGNKNSKGRFFRWKEYLIRMKPHIRMRSKEYPLRIHLLLLPSKKTKYEAIYGHTKRRPIKNFPCILVGWCGDHLPTKTQK